MSRHLYLFEYVDRPPLDLGPVPERREMPVLTYRCGSCGATAGTPKRCRACNQKMTRVRRGQGGSP